MYNKLSAGAALVVVAAFAASGAASAGQANAASSSRLRATPVAMAGDITSLGYPYSGAVCQGRGERKHGTYAAFRCVARATVDDIARTWTVWAKPLRGAWGWCGSALSLKTCHRFAAPVYGSEHKCNSNGSRCSLSSDTAAALDAYLYDGPGYTRGAETKNSCTASGTNAYKCATPEGSYTVAWTKASYGWLPEGTRTS